MGGFSERGAAEGRQQCESPGHKESGGRDGDGSPAPSRVLREACFRCGGGHRKADCPFNERDGKE